MNPEYDRKIYIQGRPHPFVFPGEKVGNQSVNELLAKLHLGDASIPERTDSTWEEVPGEECYKVIVVPKAQTKS